MSSGRAKQIISQQGKQIASLKGRMKLGKFMSLPEDDFQKLIKEIKNDSLFKRLAAPDTKVIRHKNFQEPVWLVPRLFLLTLQSLPVKTPLS